MNFQRETKDYFTTLTPNDCFNRKPFLGTKFFQNRNKLNKVIRIKDVFLESI